MYAIYEQGKYYLKTTVDNPKGVCHYTNKTVDEYLKELGNKFSCIPLEEALDKIHEVETASFIKPWKEIDADKYDYWLCVLPPEKWKTVDGVNIFRISERLTGNITQHVATTENRYFAANRRISDSYDRMAKEIKRLV